MYYNKHNSLLKSLFQKLAILTLGVNYGQVRLNILYDKCIMGNCYYPKDKLIEFNYYTIKLRIKKGYSDDYYEGRRQKINNIIHNNKKKCLRFILLHELYHHKQRHFQKKGSDYPRAIREREADDFAINTLQKKAYNV